MTESTGAEADQVDEPDGPVVLVEPFGPGGGPDLVARALAPRLAEIWGVAVGVDNRAGAGATAAPAFVAAARPDGRTLLSAGGRRNPGGSASHPPVLGLPPISASSSSTATWESRRVICRPGRPTPAPTPPRAWPPVAGTTPWHRSRWRNRSSPAARSTPWGSAARVAPASSPMYLPSRRQAPPASTSRSGTGSGRRPPPRPRSSTGLRAPSRRR